MVAQRQPKRNAKDRPQTPSSADRRAAGEGVSLPASPVTPQRSLRKRLILGSLILVVCVATAAVHWPVLSAQALCFDDQQYLTDNALVCKPSWRSAGRFLTEVLAPSTVAGYYQPLNMISLMLDYAMGGRPENLRPFHRTSLALHVLNTAMIILLLLGLFDQPVVAAMAGLLYGVHPLTVEPIAWVGERKTLLASFFNLACLLTYVHYCRRGGRAWSATSLVLYVFALVSKPTAAPLPLLLLLLDYWPLHRFRPRMIIEKIPFFAVLVVFAVITVISQAHKGGIEQSGEGGLMQIPAMIGYLIPFYLGKIVWPTNLTSAYVPPDPLSLLNPLVACGAVATCVLLGLTLVSLRWTRGPFVGWLFFLIAIFPTLGVVKYTWMIAADKYVYLPLVGLLMVLTWAIGHAWKTGPRLGTPVKAVLAVLVLLIGTAEARGARQCIARWRDTVTHAEYMANLAPNLATVHNHLGDAVGSRGRLDEAIGHFRTALALKPGYSEAVYNLGMALRLRGDLEEATDLLLRCVRSEPSNADAHYGLGLAMISQGERDKGVAHLREALRIRPDLAIARYSLGKQLELQGNWDEAADQFRQALDRLPDNAEVCASLGSVLQAQGRLDEAIKCFRRSIQINPGNADNHSNLGALLAREGRFDEAIHHFKAALSVDPAHAESHYNWGLSLQFKGDFAGAIAHYGQALAIRADYAEAHNGLGIALVKSNRPKEALEHLQEAVRLQPRWLPPLNAAAWLMATNPDAATGHEDEAVRLAERAAELRGFEDSGVLDTLAAAYASAGLFDKAVATAERAQALALGNRETKMTAEIAQRLELYRQGKPYRESAPSSAPPSP